MKLKLKFPKFSFRTITAAIFIFIIFAEILITLNYLYKNLNTEATVVSDEKIIQADLKGYGQILTDLKARDTYEASEFFYQNSNPFKFGE